MIKALGINFNNKHSYDDFGLFLEYFKPQLPQPKKILEPIAGMNGDGYDFSTVLTNGEIVYTGRNLNCKFNFAEIDKVKLERQYTRVAEWLLGVGKAVLKADSLPGYYFMAEAQEVPEWDEVKTIGSLTVVFRADPFKYGEDLAGELLWDNIDFDLPDYIQNTKFDVSGSKTVTLYNPATHPIIPKVVCNSSMACTLNSYIANFNPATTTDWAFKLLPGANSISITGTGNIDFEFRKEVL